MSKFSLTAQHRALYGNQKAISKHYPTTPKQIVSNRFQIPLFNTNTWYSCSGTLNDRLTEMEAIKNVPKVLFHHFRIDFWTPSYLPTIRSDPNPRSPSPLAAY